MVGICRSASRRPLQSAMRIGLQRTPRHGRPATLLTSDRPLLFGYLRLRITDDPSAADAGRRLLGDFADAEGFALVDVFVDADENTPQAALAALIRCVQDADVHLSG